VRVGVALVNAVLLALTVAKGEICQWLHEKWLRYLLSYYIKSYSTTIGGQTEAIREQLVSTGK
jgi:hypothetical protein